MTNLQKQHHERLDFIAREYWRQYESNSEHAERVDAAEAEAGRLFDAATVGQKQAHIDATAGLAGWATPFDNRRREAALARWYATTAEARALFEASFEEILRDGESSEATMALWDALPAFVDLRECA